MNIGEPVRVIICEPLELPAPLRREDPQREPQRIEEPEYEPVGVPTEVFTEFDERIHVVKQ